MGAWNQGRLIRTNSNFVARDVFDESLREQLGEHADAAWEIVSKFDGHGIAMNTFYILVKGIKEKKIPKAIAYLNTLWNETVIVQGIPPLAEMTPEHEESIANRLLVIDLWLK